MGDLIWIGNILLPREVVYWTAAVVVVAIIMAFTILTDERRHKP